MEATAYLSDWLTQFLRSRNAVFRTLESIGSHDAFDLYIRHKAKEQFAVCRPRLVDALPLLSPDKDVVVCCFNTVENYEALLGRWKELCAFPKLTIYFINPLSSLEKKWLINPYVHSRIADPSSFKLGLKTMFETVEPLSERQIVQLLADAPQRGPG